MRHAIIALCFAASTCAAAPLQLNEQEQAGQQIYLKGESPSGARLVGRMGLGALELAGAPIACGNCHGEDGRGRAEGGVEPQNIQWSELTKPYGHRHPNGRNHAAFDERLLRQTVLEGVDPDGNRLDPAMPRYAMSAKDFAALSAYLKKLEATLDPGLTDDTIRIGTLLPLEGRLAALGKSLRELWTGYFAALNERGGVHGRRLELVVENLPADTAEAQARAKGLLADRNVFALLAPLSAGVESELSEAAVTAKVPVVGPLTLFPEDVRASNAHVFHLLPGVAELAQVLVRHADQELGLAERPILLWHSDSDSGRATAEGIAASLDRAGWREIMLAPFPARGVSVDSFASALKARGIASILVLGGGADLRAFAAAAARLEWTPYLLVPGALAPRDIVDLPPAFRDHVILAYPSAPDDQRVDALREYMSFAKDAASRANQPIQIAAYSAGMLLVEGLKRTGRDVTRRKLIAALETVQGFDTGLIPKVSYNADRRIGAMGGYLLAVDLERKGLRPLGGYRRLP